MAGAADVDDDLFHDSDSSVGDPELTEPEEESMLFDESLLTDDAHPDVASGDSPVLPSIEGRKDREDTEETEEGWEGGGTEVI